MTRARLRTVRGQAGQRDGALVGRSTIVAALTGMAGASATPIARCTRWRARCGECWFDLAGIGSADGQPLLGGAGRDSQGAEREFELLEGVASIVGDLD
jgi:hypothetical protein